MYTIETEDTQTTSISKQIQSNNSSSIMSILWDFDHKDYNPPLINYHLLSSHITLVFLFLILSKKKQKSFTKFSIIRPDLFDRLTIGIKGIG